MRTSKVDPRGFLSRSRVRSTAYVLALLFCGAATYQVTLSAFDWRSSYEHARGVILDLHSTADQIRNASFIIGLNERETARAVKSAADRNQHAANALRAIREDWR